MTEHERDELEELRHQELIEQARAIEKAIQDSRERSALEHGAIINVVRESAKEYEDAVEAMREQNSHEHSRMQRIHDWVASQIGRLMARFGFLHDKDSPGPQKRPARDDTWPGDKK